MRTKTKKIKPVLIVLAFFTLFAVVIGWRQRMPHLPAWRKALQKNYGRRMGSRIACDARRRYLELMKSRQIYPEPALREHLERQILPGLALYRALQQAEPEPEALMEEMKGYIGMAFGVMLKVIPLMRFLPRPFPLFRRLLMLAMQNYPATGWDIE